VNTVSGKLTFGFLCDFRNPSQWRRPLAEECAVLDILSNGRLEIALAIG